MSLYIKRYDLIPHFEKLVMAKNATSGVPFHIYISKRIFMNKKEQFALKFIL